MEVLPGSRANQAGTNELEAHSSIENYVQQNSATLGSNSVQNTQKGQLTNVKFNIIRSQKYQDRKAIVIDQAANGAELPPQQ